MLDFSLRTLSEKDLSELHALFQNSLLRSFYGANFNELAKLEQHFYWCLTQLETKEAHWDVICLNGSNSIIGAIGLSHIHHTHKKAELSFWLHPEYWGKQIMQAALQKSEEQYFNVLALNRLEAFVDQSNTKVQHLLQKNDYQLEGVMRQAEFNGDQAVNVCLYAKLRDDYTK